MVDTETGLQEAKELGAIDFSSILGGPLSAAVAAQAQAAMTTVDFIEKVGFEAPVAGGSSSKVRTVTFTYNKSVPVPGGSGETTEVPQSVSVPILTIVPIPYLRVQDLAVVLNVKLTSTQSHTNTNTFVSKTEIGQSGFWSIFSPVKMSGTIQEQNVNVDNNVLDATYSLRVSMNAVQDRMPGGMSKVLGLFESVIESSVKTPATTPTTPTTPTTDTPTESPKTG